jgi:hypothetical protein
MKAALAASRHLRKRRIAFSSAKIVRHRIGEKMGSGGISESSVNLA